MTKGELRALCVNRPDNLHRFNLFLAFNALIERLHKHKVACELWVDGSFVTEKKDPSDVDVSIMIASDVFDSLSDEAKLFVKGLSLLEGRYEEYLDIFVCVIHPKGSAEREIDPPEDYARQWGLGHDERYLKGFIVLEVPHAIQ